MKQVIRSGVWETNSSSAHTICLKSSDVDKEPEEVLGDAPKELIDWVRKEGFYIGREETFKYPSPEIERFEFKLSSIFIQIASNSDMFGHLWRNKSTLTPRDLICDGKFYKVFEKLVRELGFKVVVGDISYDTWQYYFSDLDGDIESDRYVWNTYLMDDSYFREDWESSLSTLFLRYLFLEDEVTLFDGEDWETDDLVERDNLRIVYSERY